MYKINSNSLINHKNDECNEIISINTKKIETEKWALIPIEWDEIDELDKKWHANQFMGQKSIH